MTVAHAILGFVLFAIVGIGLGYGFRGLINRIGKYFRKDLIIVAGDVRTQLGIIRHGGETDVAKLKAALDLVIVKLEKVL